MRWGWILLCTVSGLAIGEFAAGSKKEEKGSEEKELASPGHIHVKGTNMYIADTDNHCIQRWSLEENAAYTGFTVAGDRARKGQKMFRLSFPLHAWADTDNDALWVADTRNHRILKFEPLDEVVVTGRAQNRTGLLVAGTTYEEGNDLEHLQDPAAVVVSGNTIFILDAGNNRVVKRTGLGGCPEGCKAGCDASWTHSCAPTGCAAPVSETCTTFPGCSNTCYDKCLAAAGCATFEVAIPSSFGLNNPMGMYLEGTDVYVADTRNGRVIKFPNGNTANAEEVAIAPDYNGAPSFLYSVYSWYGYIFAADADNQVVWRWTNDKDNPVVIAGKQGARGTGKGQLKQPAGVALYEGDVLVADTNNHRVMRWRREPRATSTSCIHGSECSVLVDKGNTVPTNFMYVRFWNGTCGLEDNKPGKCLPADLFDASLDQSTKRPDDWAVSNVFDPEDDLLPWPFGTYQFGNLTGRVGVYLLCWGSVRTAGTCDEADIQLGRLTINPRFKDLDITCSRGERCMITMTGAGLQSNDSLAIINVRDSECGPDVNEENLLLCEDAAPGAGAPMGSCLVQAEWNATETTEKVFDLGFIELTGEFTLCYCTPWINLDSLGKVYCDYEEGLHEYRYPVGGVMARGALGDQNYRCLLNETCSLRVEGVGLRIWDRVRMFTYAADCGTPGEGFEEAFNTSMALYEDGNNENNRTFNYYAGKKGVWKVCYCASSTRNCTQDVHFTHQAGEVFVITLKQEDHECRLEVYCELAIKGDVSITDKIMITNPDGECGRARAVGITSPGSTTHNTANYRMRPFGEPTDYKICYCPSYDSGGPGDKACDENVEFFVTAGILTIRGPINEMHICYTEKPCSVTFTGFGFGKWDMLQVATDLDTPFMCGSSKTGATNGTLLDEEATMQRFDLGVSTAEEYPLCLCLSNNNESCFYPTTYYDAGRLTIRGAFRGQLFECTRGITCTFFVAGAGLSSRDLVMIVEQDDVCGVDMPIRQMFGQNPRYTTDPGPDGRSYVSFNPPPEAGIWKVCHCAGTPALISCRDMKEFTYAGRLSVNYIERRDEAFKCARGAPCSFSIKGSYQRETDAVLLAERELPCAGRALRVQGSNRAYSHKGKYRNRGGMMMMNRPVYENIEPGRPTMVTLYYDEAGELPDLYKQWILGPETTDDAPPADDVLLDQTLSKADREWAYLVDPERRDENGEIIEMPVELITTFWKVWDRIGGEFVTDKAIQVRGARFPGLSINPSRSDGDQCKLGHHKYLQRPGGPILKELGTQNCGMLKANLTVRRTPMPTPVADNYTVPEYVEPNGTEHPAASVVLPPIDTEIKFNFGLATETAVYRICYCTPGWDGLCHGDSSYIVDSGLLVVQVARGLESWLCRENCTLEVRLWQHTGLDLVMLQPVERGECHFAQEQTQLYEYGSSLQDILNPQVVRYGGPDTEDRIWASEVLDPENNVIDIDDEEEDETTESGFVETVTSKPKMSTRALPTRLYDVRVMIPGFYHVCVCSYFDLDLTELNRKKKAKESDDRRLQGDVDLMPCTTYSEFFQTAGIVKVSEEEYFEVLEETEFYFEIQASPTDLEAEEVEMYPTINLGEVRVISMEDSCGEDVRRAQGLSAAPGILVNNGTTIRYEIGIVYNRDLYRICYCPEDCRDAGGFERPLMFDQTLGSVEVQIILPETHFCVVGRNCSLMITGFMLAGTDRMILTDRPCGDEDSTGPYSSEIHVPVQPEDYANNTLDFELPVYLTPGVARKCYCDPVTGDSSVCISPLFFNAKAGIMVIQGPTPRQEFYCMYGVPCEFTADGILLTARDRIRLINLTGVTGGVRVALDAAEELCTPQQNVVPEPEVEVQVSEGPYDGARVKKFSGHGIPWEDIYTDFKKKFKVDFDLGDLVLPRMSYAVCYCVSAPYGYPCYDGNFTKKQKANGKIFYPLLAYSQEAGVLTVSGPDMGQEFSCVTGAPCTLVVRGWALTSRDFVRASLRRSEDDDEGVCAGGLPLGLTRNPAQGVAEIGGVLGAITYQSFEFNIIPTPFEELILCYCVPPYDGDSDGTPCFQYGDYPFSFGNLQVRGASGIQEFGCVLGEKCEVEIEGFTLRESDRVVAVKGSKCGPSAEIIPAFASLVTPPEPGNMSIICEPEFVNGTIMIKGHEHGRRRSEHGDPPHEHYCPREMTEEYIAAAKSRSRPDHFIMTTHAYEPERDALHPRHEYLAVGIDAPDAEFGFERLTYRFGTVYETGTIQLCYCAADCDQPNPVFSHSGGIVHIVECPGVGNPPEEELRRREIDRFVPDTIGVTGNARDPEVVLYTDNPALCLSSFFSETTKLTDGGYARLEDTHPLRFATDRSDCVHRVVPEPKMPGLYLVDFNVELVPVRDGVPPYAKPGAPGAVNSAGEPTVGVSTVEGYGIQLDISVLHGTLFWTQCPVSWMRFKAHACTKETLYIHTQILFALLPVCVAAGILRRAIATAIGVPERGFLRFIYRFFEAKDAPVVDLGRSNALVQYMTARPRMAIHLPYRMAGLLIVKAASLTAICIVLYVQRTGSDLLTLPRPECKAGVPPLALWIIAGSLFVNVTFQYGMLISGEKEFNKNFRWWPVFKDTVKSAIFALRDFLVYIIRILKWVGRLLVTAVRICTCKKTKKKRTDPIERSPFALNDTEYGRSHLATPNSASSFGYANAPTTLRERYVAKTIIGLARELKVYLDAIFATIAFQCYFELYHWAIGAMLLYLILQGLMNLSLWNKYMESRTGGLKWWILALLPERFWPEENEEDEEPTQEVKEKKKFIPGERFDKKKRLSLVEESEPASPKGEEGAADDAIEVLDSSEAEVRPRKKGCCSKRPKAKDKYVERSPEIERLLGVKQLGGKLNTVSGALLRHVILKATRRLVVSKPNDPTIVYDTTDPLVNRCTRSKCCGKRKRKLYYPPEFNIHAPRALWKRILDLISPTFVVDFCEEFYLCYFRKSRKTPGGNAARVMSRLHQQRARATLSFQMLQNCGAFLIQEAFRPAL
jgi:hypothetical protein